MGCNCGSTNKGYNQLQASAPNITKGTNQVLLKQIQEQQRQQQEIQRVIQQQSSNPSKTLIKTYR